MPLGFFKLLFEGSKVASIVGTIEASVRLRYKCASLLQFVETSIFRRVKIWYLRDEIVKVIYAVTRY